MGPIVALLVCCVFAPLLILAVLFLLIYLFRLSCSLCGVTRPSYPAAMGIILVNFGVDAIALAILEGLVGLGAQEVGILPWESWIVARFLDLPVDLAISAGLHAALMGIKFGKGIEVWFVQRLIQLSIITVIVFIGVIAYLI